MTKLTDITITVDADRAADRLEAAADRIQAVSTPPPPSRLAVAYWLAVVAGCTVIGVSAAVAGDLLAAAGWAVASLAYGALGPTRKPA